MLNAKQALFSSSLFVILHKTLVFEITLRIKTVRHSDLTIGDAAVVWHMNVIANNRILYRASVYNCYVVHDHRVDYFHIVSNLAVISNKRLLHRAFFSNLRERSNLTFGTNLSFRIDSRIVRDESTFHIRFNRKIAGSSFGNLFVDLQVRVYRISSNAKTFFHDKREAA